MDVQRYLADEPVLACPPSAGYRLRKFARRNKGWLAVTALMLFFLVLLGGGIGWAVRDRAARQAKTAEQVDSIFAETDRFESQEKWPEALAAARRAEAAVTGGEVDAETAERVRRRLKELAFIDRLEQIRMQRATTIDGRYDNTGADREYARAFRDFGVDIGDQPAETSIERLREHPSLAIPLAAALDDWNNARRLTPEEKDRAGWELMVAVARGIDPDPSRDLLRASWGQPASKARDKIRRLADTIDIPAQHPVTLSRLAGALRGIKQPESALRLLQDAQRIYPGDFWLNIELGSLLYEQKDHVAALRFYTAAVALRSNSGGALNGLGNALVGQKKLDEAIAAFTKAIKLAPTDFYAHYNLGSVHSHQQQLDKAIAEYRKAIELNPRFAAAYNNLGATLRQQNKLDEAVAAYRKAIELGTKEAGTYHNLGDVLFVQKKLDDAATAYRGAIRLQPDHASAHLNLGVVLKAQGKIDEAIAEYRETIRLNKDFPAAHNNLGNALGDKGKFTEAVVSYREAVRLKPDYPEPHRSLAVLLILSADPKLRDPRRAVEHAKKAVALRPTNDEYWQALGWAQYRAGDWVESIQALEKSCKLQPGETGDAGQWTVLALAHARLAAQETLPAQEREQHKAKARRWYERADERITSKLKWRVRPAGNYFFQAIWDFREEGRGLLLGANGSKK
jgi:tetratricopeptide (TPR) repeat protein